MQVFDVLLSGLLCDWLNKRAYRNINQSFRRPVVPRGLNNIDLSYLWLAKVFVCVLCRHFWLHADCFFRFKMAALLILICFEKVSSPCIIYSIIWFLFAIDDIFLFYLYILKLRILFAYYDYILFCFIYKCIWIIVMQRSILWSLISCYFHLYTQK